MIPDLEKWLDDYRHGALDLPEWIIPLLDSVVYGINFPKDREAGYQLVKRLAYFYTRRQRVSREDFKMIIRHLANLGRTNAKDLEGA
jgi:hypothetical protein